MFIIYYFHIIHIIHFLEGKLLLVFLLCFRYLQYFLFKEFVNIYNRTVWEIIFERSKLYCKSSPKFSIFFYEIGKKNFHSKIISMICVILYNFKFNSQLPSIHPLSILNLSRDTIEFNFLFMQYIILNVTC